MDLQKILGEPNHNRKFNEWIFIKKKTKKIWYIILIYFPIWINIFNYILLNNRMKQTFFVSKVLTKIQNFYESKDVD